MLHLYQPREPVQNIGTEPCRAAPYRWPAPYEADEACAGIKLSRQPQNE